MHQNWLNNQECIIDSQPNYDSEGQHWFVVISAFLLLLEISPIMNASANNAGWSKSRFNQ